MSGYLKKTAAAGVLVLGALAAGGAQAQIVVQGAVGTVTEGLATNFALKERMFEAAGLDAPEVLVGRGGGEVIRTLIAAGDEGAYALVSLEAAVTAIRSGLPIKIVNLESRSLANVALVVMPDSDVQGVSDLSGKTVAITNPLSLTDIFTRAAEQAGDLDTPVERVPLGGIQAGLVALQSGTVDAAVLLEPRVTASEVSGEFRSIFSGAGLPAVGMAVGVSPTAFIEKNPEYLRAFLTVRQEANRIMLDDPARVAASLAAEFSVSEDVFAETITRLAEGGYFTVTGAREDEPLEAMVELLKTVGTFEGEVNWDEVFDDRFIPASTD